MQSAFQSDLHALFLIVYYRQVNWSRSAACNPTLPLPLESSLPKVSELLESEGSPDSNVGQEALEQNLLLLADVARDVQKHPFKAEMVSCFTKLQPHRF